MNLYLEIIQNKIWNKLKINGRCFSKLFCNLFIKQHKYFKEIYKLDINWNKELYSIILFYKSWIMVL